MSDDQDKVEASGVSRMLMLGSKGQARLWRADELEAICRHQLQSPMEFDLGTLSRSQQKQMAAESAAKTLLIRSFADLLLHPHPPVELLEMTRQYAKACRSDPEPAIPPEVASLLYYASILAARMRCGARLGSLDDHTLAAGTRTLLGYGWLDPAMRGLLNEGLRLLEGGAT